MSFDPTINAGHLLTFAAFVIGAFGAVWALRSDIRVVTVKQEAHGEALKKVSDLLELSIRSDERLTAQAQRLNEQDARWNRMQDDIASLRRGEGLIVKDKRG